MRAVQLSKKSVEHYGPDYIGNMVRDVFGGPINLDPASTWEANLLIGAERFYNEEQDGLSQPWTGTVYLNPPGGSIKYQGKRTNRAALWYATLAYRFALGHVSQAVFMVFNLELFRYAQRWTVPQPLTFPTCFPKDRIDFWKPGPVRTWDLDGTGNFAQFGVPVPQGSPGHPNALIYMGPNVDAFRAVFGAAKPGTRWSGGTFK
jgi:hypothetical protein